MFGNNLWSGPRFEPVISKGRETFGTGKLRVRPTRGSEFLCYRETVNSRGVRLLEKSFLFLASEATESLLQLTKPPQIVLPLSLYVIRIISLVSLLSYLVGL